MRPDMQPENSQDGAGAHEMQPESESSATTALPAYRITTFIHPIESDADQSGAYEPGAYESGANETGAYETGAFESDANETGAYELGAYESDANETGSYEPGAYESDANEPGAYESGARESGAYESGVYEPGAYEPLAYEPLMYESGVYEPSAYESGVYESGANESGPAQLSQSRLAAVLEETPDFVGIADVEGDLLFVNAAGRKMVGLGPMEALAPRKIFDCHPDWACRIIRQEGIPTALQNGFWSGETAALRPDGVEIPVSQVIVAHRNSENQVEYLSTILRDITERKRAEMIQVRLRRQAALRATVNVALAEREAHWARFWRDAPKP